MTLERLTEVFNGLAADATPLAIAFLTFLFLVMLILRPLPWLGASAREIQEQVVKAAILLAIVPLLLQVLPRFISEVLSSAE